MRELSGTPDRPDFHEVFARVQVGASFAVAVSGGGDSMALLDIAHRFAAESGARLLALTVDHRLRPDSAEEAQQVAAFCARHGIAHRTLRADEDIRKGSGNLQGKARDLRYRLLAAACHEAKIPTLMTAHTLDDQAETLMLRLARGSGVDGLAAIPVQSEREGLRLVRPLLGVSRSALRSHLRERGVEWIEDPSNDDPGFDRVRMRRALAGLADLGLTAQRLARTAATMRDARIALDALADRVEAETVRFFPLGYAEIAAEALLDAPRETMLRVLARILCRVSGAPYRPRFSALERVAEALRIGDDSVSGGRSLHGCLLRVGPAGLTICREPSAVEPRRALGPSGEVWDRRFAVSRAGEATLPEGLAIGAAGEDGLARLAAEKCSPPDAWIAAPRAARLSSPTLWYRDEWIGIPFAGIAEGWPGDAVSVRHLGLIPGAQVDCQPNAVI